MFVPLCADDLPAVMDLQERILNALPDARWYFPSGPQEFRDDLLHDEMLGLWDHGRLIALGNGTCRQTDSTHYAADVGDDPREAFSFVDVMVDPAHRRRGYHTRLLQLYRERAEKLHCRAIYATVDPSNLPSRQAFEKAGYEALTEKPAYDGRPRVYYRLLLPPVNPQDEADR